MRTIEAAALGCTQCLLSGCAIRYSDRRTGAEHLWGFGQLRLQTSSAAGNLATVTSGSRVPGLCLDIGRDHFGVSIGYVSRQQLEVVDVSAASQFKFPSTSQAIRLSGDRNAPWALGHVRMSGVVSPARRYAIVTGRALAGLGAGAVGGDTSVGFVLDGRQKTIVTGEKIGLDFDQDAPRWPGFDLFAMKVKSTEANTADHNPQQGEP